LVEICDKLRDDNTTSSFVRPPLRTSDLDQDYAEDWDSVLTDDSTAQAGVSGGCKGGQGAARQD
jgi:hypothetical protein